MGVSKGHRICSSTLTVQKKNKLSFPIPAPKHKSIARTESRLMASAGKGIFCSLGLPAPTPVLPYLLRWHGAFLFAKYIRLSQHQNHPVLIPNLSFWTLKISSREIRIHQEQQICICDVTGMATAATSRIEQLTASSKLTHPVIEQGDGPPSCKLFKLHEAQTNSQLYLRLSQMITKSMSSQLKSHVPSSISFSWRTGPRLCKSLRKWERKGISLFWVAIAVLSAYQLYETVRDPGPLQLSS
jgi:hypothetical protein